MYFELFEERGAKKGRGWSWRLKEENGKIIASAAGYDRQDIADDSVTDIKLKAAEIARAERRLLTVKAIPSRSTSASSAFGKILRKLAKAK